MTLAEINALDRDALHRQRSAASSSIRHGSPKRMAKRPFASVDALHAAMIAAMQRAPASTQLALMRAHPELAGKAAIRGEITAESKQRARGRRPDPMLATGIRAPDRAQSRLQREVRLPVHHRGQGARSRGDHRAFEARLKNDRVTEFDMALAQIARICRLRLETMLET